MTSTSSKMGREELVERITRGMILSARENNAVLPHQDALYAQAEATLTAISEAGCVIVGNLGTIAEAIGSLMTNEHEAEKAVPVILERADLARAPKDGR